MPAVLQQSDSRSITSVVHGIVDNVQDLMRAEVQLAKVEVVQAVTEAGRATKLLATGAALAQIAAGFLLFGAVMLLSTRIPLWLAAVSVGAVVGVIAVVLLKGGAGRLRDVSLSPTSTAASRE